MSDVLLKLTGVPVNASEFAEVVVQLKDDVVQPERGSPIAPLELQLTLVVNR